MTTRRAAGIAIATVVVLASAAVYLQYQTREFTTLQSAIARAFGRSPEFIELNLPPADGRYPGAILVSPAPGRSSLCVGRTGPKRCRRTQRRFR